MQPGYYARDCHTSAAALVRNDEGRLCCTPIHNDEEGCAAHRFTMTRKVEGSSGIPCSRGVLFLFHHFFLQFASAEQEAADGKEACNAGNA